MKNQIKFIALLLGIGISLGFLASAAPTQTFYKDIFPITNQTYNLGTSTLQFLGISVKNASTTVTSATSLCLSGDICRTTWPAGGSGTPGGADTHVQFNDSSSFGGDSGLTYNKTLDILTATNASSTNATLTNFWSTNGQITNASTTNLTISTYFNSKGSTNIGDQLNINNGTGIVFFSDDGITTTGEFAIGNNYWNILNAGGIGATFDFRNIFGSTKTFYLPNIDNGTFLVGSATNTISNLTITNASTTYLTVSGSAFLASSTMNGFNICTSDNGACPSGSGTPGGANTQVQFNNSSAFGGDADFTFDSTGNLVTMTNASTTAFSVASTGYFNLNATGTMQGWALCTAGNGACGAGSVPNSTVTASEEIWDCVPQTDSTGFAPGGSFIDVMGENLLAIHQMNATTSAIYCRWHVPDDIAASPSAVLFTNYAATSSGNLAIDIYATTTPSNGGVYGTFGLWTTVKAGSTSPVTITGGSDYQSTSTTTPINLTLTAGDDLIFRMIRWASDANDTVEGVVFFVKNYIQFLKKIN